MTHYFTVQGVQFISESLKAQQEEINQTIHQFLNDFPSILDEIEKDNQSELGQQLQAQQALMTDLKDQFNGYVANSECL